RLARGDDDNVLRTCNRSRGGVKAVRDSTDCRDYRPRDAGVARSHDRCRKLLALRSTQDCVPWAKSNRNGIAYGYANGSRRLMAACVGHDAGKGMAAIRSLLRIPVQGIRRRFDGRPDRNIIYEKLNTRYPEIRHSVGANSGDPTDGTRVSGRC